MYPPAPQSLLRVTPRTDKGISPNGYSGIPGGVCVGSSAYSLHRIEDVYTNPEEWLRKRYLQPGEGKPHDMRRLWFPFVALNFYRVHIPIVLGGGLDCEGETKLGTFYFNHEYDFLWIRASLWAQGHFY